MGVFTTQTFADNTRSTGTNDARVDESNIVNNDAREYAEISYMTEASLTAVCRLNKCWASAAGYQACGLPTYTWRTRHISAIPTRLMTCSSTAGTSASNAAARPSRSTRRGSVRVMISLMPVWLKPL